MKPEFTSLIRVAIALLTLIFASCNRPAESRIGQLVEISCDRGVQVYTFMNMMSADAISTPGIPQTRLCLFLTDAELLAIVKEEDDAEQGFNHLYFKEDGDKLDFRFDGDLLYVNDRVRSITIDNGGEGTRFSDWIARASEDDLRLVRSLIVEKSEDQEKYLPEIEKIIRVNPAIQVDFNLEMLSEEILTLWKPRFLAYDDKKENAPSLGQLNLSELRILSFGSDFEFDEFQGMLTDMKALSRASTPKLCHLKFGAISFTGDIDLAKFSSWLPADEETEPDWTVLGDLFEIRGLRVDAEDDPPVDFWLYLNSLNLLAIGNSEPLTGIENLSQLEYLAIGAVSEDELSKIIAANPQLVFLDLFSSGLTRFNAVAGAKNLEGVILCEMPDEIEYDFTPLSSLKHLRYIGLPYDLLSEPAVVEKVRAACPNCIIGGHAGICLGAGWLVLFLPLLGMVLFLKRFRGEIK
ncbi:MAG TPA: hypothetical protein VK995_00995 [Oceanipulchritudo sp.]|nr:hypothetical protein [Oceanipulchritudo sp.]